MSASTRAKLEEDIDRAYEIQSKAAIQGATRFAAVGVGLSIVGHYSWPAFRRQTLPFKGFLISTFTIFGLVIGAEHALLSHQAEKRAEENVIRREARLALARQGLIGTETEISKWREEREKSIRSE